MAFSNSQSVRGPRLQISTQTHSRLLATSTTALGAALSFEDLDKRSRSTNPPLSSINRSKLPSRTNGLSLRSSTAVPPPTLPPIKKLARSLTAVDYTASFDKDLRPQRVTNGSWRLNDRGDKRKPMPLMLDVNRNPAGLVKSTSTESVCEPDDKAKSNKPTFQIPRKVRALTAYERCITRLERAASAPDLGRLAIEGMVSRSIKRYMHSVAELKARFNKLAVIREELEVHPALPVDCRTPVLNE